MQQMRSHINQVVGDYYKNRPNDRKDLHSFQPGDLVFIRKLLSSLEPQWTGPWTIILTTPTAVKVAAKPAWIHWTPSNQL